MEFSLLLDALSIEKYVQKADYVFTGEGKIDAQTLFGKTIAGLANITKKQQTPLLVLTGKIGTEIEGLYKIGVSAIFSIVNQPMSLESAIENADSLIRNTSATIMRTIISEKSRKK